MNPVLKKASPPSVTTVSKECNVSNMNSTSATNNNNIKTIYNGSNNSLTVGGSGFVSGYETDGGTNISYKRSAFKQPKNDEQGNIAHTHHGPIYSIEPPPYPASIKPAQITRPQQTTISSLSTKNFQAQPVLPVKQLNSRAASGPEKISIITQPLPEIPPKTMQNQRNQQPLSASNLTKYRSMKAMPENIDVSASSKHFNDNHGRIVVKSSAPLHDQPPMLPPKNRNKVGSKQSISKQPHMQPGTKTFPQLQKSSKIASDKKQQTTYSTFGYDHSARDLKKYYTGQYCDSSESYGDHCKPYRQASSLGVSHKSSRGTSNQTSRRQYNDNTHSFRTLNSTGINMRGMNANLGHRTDHTDM
ncbi:uncharacterized protein LOC129570155 [Sitodiplosis mosellana]|uniref:uncharacterized protein LOC129570155 n=1 Tax=Sitodiplosis mosellana TaxID=263140 RepID=UPI002445029D|nr:uncharacterized protein LOC129570155 [Sitodiplosis mosellana]